VNGNLLKLSVLVFLLIALIPLPSLAAGKDLKIALILWRGETIAERGFKFGLEELGYTTEFITFNAAQDVTKLGNALSSIASRSDEFDYVYTFGTTISRRAKLVLNNKIPQLFNVVTDPVGAGIIENTTAERGNIGGASDAVSLSRLVEIIIEIFDFQKLGLFFNPREKNSLLIRKKIKNLAKIHHFEVVDFRSPPAAQILQENLQKLIDNPKMVDAVYLPADSFLVSNASLIGRQLRSAEVVSIGSVRNFIEAGVLMGFAVDYYELGKAVATIADRNQRGEELQKIPVARGDFSLMINQTTLELLGIKRPEFESMTIEIIP